MNDLEILDFMEKTLDLHVNWIDKSDIGFSLYTEGGYKIDGRIVRSNKVGLDKSQITREVHHVIFKCGFDSGVSDNQASLRALLGIEE